MDADTRADGGDLGFRAQSDLSPQIRQAVQNAHVGDVIGPIQIGDTWHLIRVDDIRQRGSPSLESLRPQIINWLRYQEVMQLQDRLERDARIERLREPDTSMAPTEETPAPADATPEEEQAPAPTPDEAHPGGPAPPFPFPMGPGGVTAQQQAPRPTPNMEGPSATAVGGQQTAPPPAPTPQQPASDQPVQ